MTYAVASAELESFRAVIERRFGLEFDETKLGFLTEVLQRRVDATGRAPGIYLHQLGSEAAPTEELRILAHELTVAETYFFRNNDQFRALREVALPHRIEARAIIKRIAILSAGCASGEEAYSIAILTHEHVPDSSWIVSIVGVDINPAVLEKAAAARYSGWSLRETPDEMRQRWFLSEGREFILDPEIRDAVRFEERNLCTEDPKFWRDEAYDIIFCRNVLNAMLEFLLKVQ